MLNKERILKERSDAISFLKATQERMKRLNEFIESDDFCPLEELQQALLKMQNGTMAILVDNLQQYCKILEKRLE